MDISLYVALPPLCVCVSVCNCKQICQSESKKALAKLI